MAAAVEEICEIGIEEVWRHDLILAETVVTGANHLGIGVVSPMSAEERSAIVSLRLPDGVSSEVVAQRLQDEYSILVTSRSGFLRVSPHIDNSIEQVNSLISALEEILN